MANAPIPIRPVQAKRLPASPDKRSTKEIATLEVRGNLFTNWTSVRVEQKVTDAFPVFQFECTEESPIPLKLDAMQFIPGDVVRVYVGGVPAVFGYITERHVAYDAKQHAVRLIGVGDTFDLTNSMVPLEKLSGHEDLKLPPEIPRFLRGGCHLCAKYAQRWGTRRRGTPSNKLRVRPPRLQSEAHLVGGCESQRLVEASS